MLGLLVVATLLVFVREGTGGLADGGEGAVRLLLRAAPFVLLGIGMAGMLTVLIPPSAIGRWMGDDAGFAGLAIGVAAGAFSPGGPYIAYPLAAGMMSGGAGIGPLAGFLAMRNAFTVSRLLVWDIPFLGLPFTAARVVGAIWLPLVSVVLVPVLFRLMPAGAREAARTKLARTSEMRTRGKTRAGGEATPPDIMDTSVDTGEDGR